MMRIEKILCTVLNEAHERQIDEAIDTLSEDRRTSTKLLNATKTAGQPGHYPFGPTFRLTYAGY